MTFFVPIAGAPGAAGAAGAPAWDQLDLSPEGFWRADFKTLNGADVSALSNQGSAAADFSQITASLQPLWVASDPGFNNRPTCDGLALEFLTTGIITSLDLADGDDCEIIVVFKSASASTGGIWGDGNSRGFQVHRGSGGALKARAKDDSGASIGLSAAGTVGETAVHVVRMTLTGEVSTTVDNLHCRIDGGAGQSGTLDLGAIGSANHTILAKTSAGAIPWDGQWAETLLIRRILTSGERTSYRDLLNTYYDLSLTAI